MSIEIQHRALEIMGFKIVDCRSDVGRGLYPERGYLIYDEEFDLYEINSLNKIRGYDGVFASHRISYEERSEAWNQASNEIKLENRSTTINNILNGH